MNPSTETSQVDAAQVAPTAHSTTHVGVSSVGALAAGAVALAPQLAQAAVSIGSTTPVQSYYDGWRFLTQATFGPSKTDLDQSPTSTTATAKLLWTKGYSAWLEDQFLRKPKRTTYQMTLDRNGSWPRTADGTESPTGRVWMGRNKDGNIDMAMLYSALWEQYLSGADQLRQRVAFALSEIFVISFRGVLGENVLSVAAFHDMLVKNAFGSFRTLVEDVCKSPAMGMYLTHIRNQKPLFQAGTNKPVRIPDQNFSRELMQLFTIGLVKLNIDGTLELDANGKPIETYTPDDIRALSFVFTGWGFWSRGTSSYPGNKRIDLGFYSDGVTSNRTNPNWLVPDHLEFKEDLYNWAGGAGVSSEARLQAAENICWDYARRPMVPYDSTNPYVPASLGNNNQGLFENQHAEVNDFLTAFNTTAPTFLGKPLQATGTCEGDLKNALDILLSHQNVAPFISKQMIQRLVTSNPSPAYVRRVAQQFKSSNYSLKTLVKAILLDTEARDVTTIRKSTTYGKLREPLLRVTAAIRGVTHLTRKHPVTQRPIYAVTPTHLATNSYPANRTTILGQGAYHAPSVFNFFRPGYVDPGSKSAAKGLVAPELQIASGAETTGYINALLHMFWFMGFGAQSGYTASGSLADGETQPLWDYEALGATGLMSIGEQRWRRYAHGIEFDYSQEIALLGQAGGGATFINSLDNKYFGGAMTASLRSKLNDVLNQPKPASYSVTDMNIARTAMCHFLALISAEFVVQK